MEETIGIIGLGRLGTLVARAFDDEGYEVNVYDIDEDRVDAVAGDGINGTTSPEATARESDVVVVIVGTADQVEGVLFGDDGVAAGADGGTMVAISSTVHPMRTVEWATRFEDYGELVDAPVARGPLIPERGALVLLGGGSETLDLIGPTFAAMAGSVVELGSVGAGQCGKLANNQIFWTCHVANYEAVCMAKAFGLDTPAMLDALEMGSGDNYALRRWGEVSDEWASEDLDIVLDVADQTGLELPLSEEVRRIYDEFTLEQAWGLLEEDG